MAMTLSVVIPAYNEENTIAEVIKRVSKVNIEKEIIVVDDASRDNTQQLLQELKETNKNMHIIRFKKNQGKGAAIIEGIKAAKNDLVIIQDADLEYNPEDYIDLIKPIEDGEAEVVYGSRFLTTKSRRVHYYWHYVANQLLTMLSNIFSNLNISDMETCYKLFKREIIQSIKLKEKRFGIEPEMTQKLAKKKVRFYEVGISYHGRSYEEGKKIGLKDAFRAAYCIVKYGFLG